MRKINGIENNSEFDIYFRSENLENTDFPQYEELDVREPDAFIGFTNEIFLNPMTAFINPDETTSLDWYNKMERR